MSMVQIVIMVGVTMVMDMVIMSVHKVVVSNMCILMMMHHHMLVVPLDLFMLSLGLSDSSSMLMLLVLFSFYYIKRVWVLLIFNDLEILLTKWTLMSLQTHYAFLTYLMVTFAQLHQLLTLIVAYRALVFLLTLKRILH